MSTTHAVQGAAIINAKLNEYPSPFILKCFLSQSCLLLQNRSENFYLLLSHLMLFSTGYCLLIRGINSCTRNRSSIFNINGGDAFRVSFVDMLWYIYTCRFTNFLLFFGTLAFHCILCNQSFILTRILGMQNLEWECAVRSQGKCSWTVSYPQI